ncbi:MAG: phosphatase PAP2 family protein [Acholeplasmataceae bacterium]|jgi:undecaprenyl-diphosphatase|nr:phosphatase PAP2 family protein [Acholeplasmataceae bacterium]
MQVIEFIQKFSNPFLDWFFRIITEAGDTIFFIVVGAILYWVFDKKFAFKLMISFLFSALINGVIKHFTKKPRPYEEGAEAILQRTGGSSMPSGHSQGIGALGSMMIYEYKEVKWIRYVSIALMILVPFSRMYLGQHYLEDVIVGLILGIFLGLLGLYLLSVGNPDKEDIRAFYLIPLFILLMIFFPNNQLFVAGGAYIGLTLGYFLEKRYVKYDTKEVWWIQILKVLFGLLIAIGLKEGIKPLFKLIHGNNETLENIFDAVRYFLVALWASLGAMFTFEKVLRVNGEKRFIKKEKVEVTN